MRIQVPDLLVNRGFLLQLGYQTYWPQASRSSSYFSMTADDVTSLPKGTWLVDGTMVCGSGSVVRWRVAIWRDRKNPNLLCSAIRHSRRKPNAGCR